MSYYASFSGELIFPKEKKESLEALIAEGGLSSDIDHTEEVYVTKEGELALYISGYDRYKDFYFEDLFALVAPLGLIHGEIEFIGEDNALWKLVWENGEMVEYDGEVVYHRAGEPREEKVVIPLDKDRSLVAVKNSDPEYKEIIVFLQKEGSVYQDLAVVRERYCFSKDSVNPIPVKGEYEVLVYADPQSEDYTERFQVREWEEENA